MPKAPIVKMSAERQAQYIQHLIDQMFGNDVHDQPKAHAELKGIVDKETHSDDCARNSNTACNCGIMVAKAYISAEAR